MPDGTGRYTDGAIVKATIAPFSLLVIGSPALRTAHTATDFKSLFTRFRALLAPYASTLTVQTDGSSKYYLNSSVLTRSKRPIMFAGVSIEKAYVSFHLMPVYTSPELLQSMSPELRKRMQGKACFNFRKVDEKLFTELESLTRTGFDKFKESGYL